MSTSGNLFLLLFCLLLSLLCSACIEDISDCVKGNRAMREAEYYFQPISGITAWDGLDIILHKAHEQSIIVKAGKNILPNIQLNMKEGNLHIRDNNSCNWSKAYEKREVHLYLNQLDSIYQNGYGLIQSVDTIQSKNLIIKARIGSGDIDLLLNAEQVEVESSRYGTIRLSGETKKITINYLENNAIFDGRTLIAEDINIFHKSNNDFHLYPLHSLTGKLLARGNVYLYHQPKTVDILNTGRGNIIYQSQ